MVGGRGGRGGPTHVLTCCSVEGEIEKGPRVVGFIYEASIGIYGWCEG